MNIEEAIKEGKKWIEEHPHLGVVTGYKALPFYQFTQLGIEALMLKRQIKNAAERGDGIRVMVLAKFPLPSEMEEQIKTQDDLVPPAGLTHDNGW